MYGWLKDIWDMTLMRSDNIPLCNTLWGPAQRSWGYPFPRGRNAWRAQLKSPEGFGFLPLLAQRSFCFDKSRQPSNWWWYRIQQNDAMMTMINYNDDRRWNHNMQHFRFLGCSGGSSAAKIASSNTFFKPFCKRKRKKNKWEVMKKKCEWSIFQSIFWTFFVNQFVKQKFWEPQNDRLKLIFVKY